MRTQAELWPTPEYWPDGRRRRSEPVTIECKGCGKDIIPLDDDQEYCGKCEFMLFEICKECGEKHEEEKGVWFGGWFFCGKECMEKYLKQKGAC